MEKIIEIAGIPMLVFVICIYYGVRLIVTQKSDSIRDPKRPAPKDEKGYSRAAGILILFMAAATLVMGILLFVNTQVAMVEIVISLLIMGILWKKMNDRYGA